MRTSRPARCHAPAAAFLPLRWVGPTPPFLRALLLGRKNVIATFDGGLWGLVRLPGTGCARREN
jgi:hypothetical protein